MDDRPATSSARPAELTDQERHQILVEWNETQVPYPADRCIHELFAAQVARSPDAVAVVFKDEQLTYAELNAHAEGLATQLRGLGIGPDVLVGLYLERSLAMVVGVLGILKAGGAYLPMDPKYPQERVAFMLADAQPRVILTQAGLRPDLPASCADVILLDDPAQFASAAAPPVSEKLQVQAGHLAYVIYTSGSTGKPKGVSIEHRNAVNFIHWGREVFSPAELAGVLAGTSICFDLSVFELFVTLSSGGKVILVESVLVLPQLPARDQVTLINTVPSAMAELVKMGGLPANVRVVNLAGEPLPTVLVDKIYAAKDAIKVNDLYGPSETTTYSTYTLRQRGVKPTIGRPIANTTVYLLDERLEPVPVGAAGELYIGGAGVAREYLNRPELTAEKFIADPFSSVPGARLYRTGDLARYQADGAIEYLGRLDQQVKIRGFRIELGEIEAVLGRHPQVQASVVVAREDASGGKFLAAYLVGHGGKAPAVPELREYLLKQLPEYMVPAAYVNLEKLPLTPNGKIDRKSLPAPAAQPRQAGTRYVAPTTATQKAVAKIWSELLGVEQIGINDDFFALGGHSLQAVKLMLAVEKSTGQWLELSTFLLKPTLAEMCAALHARRAGNEIETVIAIRPTGTRLPLFCLYNITGDVDIYFNLAEALGEDQPVIGIRSPALEDVSRLPASIEAAAAEVVRCIRQVQPHGAPALVGYSWAGLLAFEVARQLEQAEGVHCFTALIGPDAPMRPTNPVSRAVHFGRHFPAWLGRLIRERESRAQRLRRWREMARSTQQSMTEVNLTIPGWADTPVSRHLLGLIKHYQPASKCEMAVDVFRERDETQLRAHPLQAWQAGHLPDAGWNRWTTKPNYIHWVPGDHWTIITFPAVTTLAQAIRAAMDRHLAASKTLATRSLLSMIYPASVSGFFQRLTDWVTAAL